jgi:hypothetical protein
LNSEFWNTESETAHSLYVGSYGRNTAIEGISDLDLLFELPYSEYKKYDDYHGNGQSALLQAVKKAIQKSYSSSEVGGDGQVVVVDFTDAKYEILPAFINKNHESYTHPDSNDGGSWKTTNPRAEISAIRARNSDCNDNLIPLCRMLRCWKDKCNVSISGMLIDTLAYQFIENWEHRDKSYFYYDFMCRDLFHLMADQPSD